MTTISTTERAIVGGLLLASWCFGTVSVLYASLSLESKMFEDVVIMRVLLVVIAVAFTVVVWLYRDAMNELERYKDMTYDVEADLINVTHQNMFKASAEPDIEPYLQIANNIRSAKRGDPYQRVNTIEP